MRVVTWNIGGGFTSIDDNVSYDTEDITYFSDMLQSFSPDFICIQEAHSSHAFDQSDCIAERLDLNVVSYAYDESHLKPGCNLTVTILSKHALDEAAFCTLPNPRLKLVWRGEEMVSHDKGFLLARTCVNGRAFHVASGHLFPFHRFGRDLIDEEFLNIRERMEQLFIEDVDEILVGADMNYDDIGKVLPRAMQDYAAVPFSSTRPDGRITDHILYPNKWECHHNQVVPTQADHYLCVADINPP